MKNFRIVGVEVPSWYDYIEWRYREQSGPLVQ